MDKYTITINTYNKSAIEYQEKFMDMDLYNDTYDKFCDLIGKRNADILEIACGPGNVTNYLLRKYPYFKILGIDLSITMISLAKLNNPTVEFKLMDCRKIYRLDKKYDAIMCGFCMPYLSKAECAKLISDSSELLNEGGLIYISTMEGDYNKSGFEKTSFSGENQIYIHYHQADVLTNELKKNGFKNIDLQRKDYLEKDGTFTTDLIIMAKKLKV